MKKQVFAFILTAALCIGLLPTNVLAEGTEEPEEAKEEVAETIVQTAEVAAEGENAGTAVTIEGEDSEEPSGDPETVSEDEPEVETEADWEATLPQDLTGIWSEDVVAVAKSQIGYTESEGYNRYDTWYGDESDAWDATFVSFCLYYADVPESEFPQASGASAWIRALKEAGQEEDTELYVDVSDAVPQSGDLVFLDTDEDGKADRVGIAEKVETEDTDAEAVKEVTVIEGDSNGTVEEKEYKAADGEIASVDAAEAAVIMGYGILPLQADEEDEAEEDPEISELAYEGEGSGRVVIDLGNSNGLCNFADYSGLRAAASETALRYTTEVLDDYADENGNLTIYLPAEEDLNSTFKVVGGIDEDHPDVSIALGNCAAYKYTLVGWVNIATGEYFDVSEGSVTADINLKDQNVFYADWIAASYDHGSSSDSDLVESTVSTKDFVTMDLYDFNEIFNMYSAKVEQNVDVDESTGEATITETWTDSDKMYDALMGANLGNGKELTNSFIFVNDGTSSSTGNLGYVAGQMARNKWSGTGGYPRDAYEQWGITSPDSAPLNVLFDQSESYHGVHYVGEGDYLFQIDEDGYYYFNSDQNTATYNQTDGRFYVYNGTQSVEYTNFPCFLPFNDYVSGLNALNGSVDYWFGMDMSVNFYLSNAVGRGGNLVNGKHMVFNFSGDDDILIFIDNELVLDMSGIHDESFGSIDFTDGTVKLAMSEAGLATAEATSFSLGAGNHELEVYYMERGGRASNLEIEFNIMPLWEYESGDVQTITAEKVWQNVDGSVVTDTKNMPDVEVGLFDVISAATDETPGYTQSGDTYTFEYTDDKNVYHKYVYTVDSDGDTLVYTEGDNTVTYSDTNSDGKVVDGDGLVIAWFEDRKLHVRIDEQTLSNDNDWTYAWELLDVSGEYEAIELSESSAYTTESTSEDLTTYQYWSIIGESEIQDHIEDSYDGYPIILTEAAQEASGSIGNTKEAYGWVIVGTTSGVETTQVKFSQIATMEEITSAESDTRTYRGVYGVTSQSEIEALGSGAVWYMEDANKEATDIGGETTLEEFRIYCMLDGTKYYLALDQNSNGLTTSTEFGASFYYDALGELMVDITDDEGNSSSVRVEIQADGTISIDVAEEEAALDDIRIYTLSETSTSGFAFTATNTLTYSFKLDKVETGKEDEELKGATFSLYKDADCEQIIGFIATEDSEGNVTYTVSEDEDAEGYTEVIEAGWVTIAGMSLDTFYLKEIEVPDNGYVHLNEVITVNVSGNGDGSVTITVDGAPNHVTADGDTITVDNDSRGITQIPVQKVWDDADDQDGIRPKSITFHLLADGVEVDSATVSATDGWAYTFTDLPLYESEDENEQVVKIVYTVTEDSIDGYDTTVDGYTVTNKHTPATTSVTVTKKWDDDLVPQIRPDEISVQLFANGVEYGEPATLTGDDWTYTWEDLPVNDAGEKIAYTVKEADVTGYTPAYGDVTGDAENGYAVTITNTPSPEKLSIQKAVAGESDTTEFEFRITLKSGETAYNGDIKVTYSDGSTGTLTFTDGSADIKITAGDTITLTLTYGMTWEVTELTKDMDSTVIYVGNEIANSASGTITGDTPVRFVNSYRGYYPIDEEIVPDYTDRSTWVKEEAVNEYNAIEIEMSTILPVITGYDMENGSFTMNFHEILDHELVLDEADADFMVYIGGNKVDHDYYTISISPDDGCSFHVDVDLTALYKAEVISEDDLQGNTEIIIFFFADLEGTGLNGTYTSTVWYEIYDLEESDEPLYTSNVDVVDVYTYEIDITKYDVSTLDGTDYDGSALAGATLGVYYDEACTDPVSRNNEPYTVTSDEDGKAVFYGLADGTYYVKEITAPAGYLLSDEVLTVVLGEELNEHGYAFEGEYANTPEPETRDISGSKTWDDDNDKADARPASITVNLYQNDEFYDSKTVTEADGWAWSWTGLPKYDEDGEAYAYTIDEDTVDYYTPTYYEGNFNITNTFVGEEGAKQPTSGPEKGGDTPKTGDTSNIGLWLALLAAALVCIGVGIRMRRKSRA